MATGREPKKRKPAKGAGSKSGKKPAKPKGAKPTAKPKGAKPTAKRKRAQPVKEERLSASIAGSLRRHTARGTLINAAYLVALNVLILVRGFAGAEFLSPAEYGIWGLLNLTLASVFWLREVGVSDKYVQQSEKNQAVEFKRAFGLSIALMSACFVVTVGVVLLFAVIYSESALVAPGIVLATVLLAAGVQFPVWTFYRRMEFAKQRLTQGVEPIVGSTVAVILLATGAGYWALVLGTVAGAWTAAIVALLVSPYPLGIQLQAAAARRYLSFSWPIVIAYVSTIVMFQLTYFIGERELGLAGLGVITFVGTLVAFADKVDSIVTQTLYPAICAVRDRTELLFESFIKSNRLALMWGVPFGVGVALFASDLVSYVIGEKWRPAVGYMELVSVAVAANHVGFNWTAFYRARDDTRPLATASVIGLALFLVIPVPLLLIHGLGGLGLGLLLLSLANLVVRGVFIVRLFPGFRMASHAARAIAPTIPAAALVLAVRLVDSGDRSAAMAAAEFALYIAATVAATWFFERNLLREAFGYLRRAGRQPPTAVLSPAAGAPTD